MNILEFCLFLQFVKNSLWADQQMDGRTDRQTDGQIDGRMEGPTYGKASYRVINNAVRANSLEYT